MICRFPNLMNKASQDLRNQMNELKISKRYLDGVVILDLDGNLVIGENSRQLHSILKAVGI